MSSHSCLPTCGGGQSGALTHGSPFLEAVCPAADDIAAARQVHPYARVARRHREGEIPCQVIPVEPVRDVENISPLLHLFFLFHVKRANGVPAWLLRERSEMFRK